MSRCFPFPPPGYEKKPQTDHVDLLIKKHKEKKHKKEKRNKEKREGKERKDREKNKDRSKDKHREKKGKKEKHRDEEKKKDNDRNGDENKILYERKNGHTEGHNGRKSGEDSHHVEDPKSAKFMEEELGRRIGDEERQAGDQMGADDTGKVRRKFHGLGIATEKERSTGNEILHSITISEQKRMGIACAMEERGATSETDQNSTGTENRRLDGMCKPMDKYANKKIERKEDKEHKVDGRKGCKHKDRDREKKHKGKDRARNKEKEKEEKIRRKGEQKHKELDKLRDSLRKEQVASENVSPLFPSNDNAKSAGAGAGGCPKRKEANGFLRENEVRPNKLLRPSCSFQSQLSPEENGNKSDQSHTGGFCTSVKDVALNLVKVEKTVDNKNHKINGVTDIHSPLNMRRPPLMANAAENGEACKKSPHPDEKHLSQILHLPKMEEWVKSDNEEWLSSGDDLWQKPETKLKADDETPKVWAEAMRIELGDVVALPFVVPF